MKSSWVKNLFGYIQLDVTMVQDIDRLAHDIISKQFLCDMYSFLRSRKSLKQHQECKCQTPFYVKEYIFVRLNSVAYVLLDQA